MTTTPCPLWRKSVSILLVLVSMVSLWIQAVPVLAASEGDSGTVTVTIEKSLGNGTCVFLCEPAQVNCGAGGTVKISDALKAAYAPQTIAEGSIYNEIKVQDATAPGGVLADEGRDLSGNYRSDARWLVLCDSVLTEGKFNRLSLSASAGSVIRLVYTTNAGTDVGFDGNKMTVNKDDLLALMAAVDQSQLEMNPLLKAAWQGASAVAVNTIATQSAVKAAQEQLYFALNPRVPAQSIQITPSSLTLNMGKQAALSAKVLPENTTDQLSWRSLNESVATVTAAGKVTAVSAGTAVIEAAAGDITSHVKVTVTLPEVESVKLDTTSAQLTEGQGLLLTATITPAEAANQLVWSSSDSTVASVYDGQVVALKAGTATITARAGSKQATCSVTVEPHEIEETPTVYFRHNDGRMVKVDGSVDLTLLDSGKFVLEGYEGTTYWQFSDGGQSWVSSSGSLYLRGLTDGIEGGVYTSNPDWGGEPIVEFTLRVVKTQLSELRLYVENKQLDPEEPFQAAGSAYYLVTARARPAGENRLVDVPGYAFTLTVDDPNKGTVSDYDKAFTVENGCTATYTATMRDGSATAHFTAVSSEVPVTGLDIQMPDSWQIDGWNGLGSQYSGLQPNIADGCVARVVPFNASNQDLKWEALTPEIAFYQPEYNNGIVPVKAGTARFRVSSVENPSFSQEFSINFSYRYPLQSASAPAAQLTLKKGTVQELDIRTVPENATEQRFVWTYDKDGIVQVQDTITSSDTSNANNPRTTVHSVYAKAAGTVTVTATPMDTTGGAEPIVFTVTVTEGGAEDSQLKAKAEKGIAHGQAYMTDSGVSRIQYGDEWTIFSILRSGGQIPARELEAYYASVCKAVKEEKMIPTDRGRVVITLLAMGKDPTNVDGVNLVEQLYNEPDLKAYPSNMLMWTLIALDAGQFEIPKDAKWNRDTLVVLILPYQKADGGFGLSLESSTTSVDITAMAVQALADYRTTEPAVRTAVNKALDYLREKLTLNAGYLEGGWENSCSAAQVLVALTEAGIDPMLEQNGFTCGENNLVSNLLSFQREQGFAVYSGSSGGVILMSTQQVTYALEAWCRMLNGENTLFDLTDVDKAPGGSEGNNGNAGNGNNSVEGSQNHVPVAPPAAGGSGNGSAGGPQNPGSSLNSGTVSAGGTPDFTFIPSQEQEEKPLADAVPHEIPVVAQPEHTLSYESTDDNSGPDNLLTYIAIGILAAVSTGAGAFFWMRRRR